MNDHDRDLAQLLAANADCPIPWCIGTVFDHGGDGDSPEWWLHTSEHHNLAGLGRAFDVQYGTHAKVLNVDLSYEADLTAGDVRELADKMGRLSDVLRAHADRLDVENGATEQQ